MRVEYGLSHVAWVAQALTLAATPNILKAAEFPSQKKHKRQAQLQHKWLFLSKE